MTWLRTHLPGPGRTAARLLAACLLLAGATACDTFGSVTRTVSGWTGSVGDVFAGYNPLGAEAIAIGRATPQIAGNNLASGGTSGVRVNVSYDLRLHATREEPIAGLPMQSWLFIDRRVDLPDYYLQIHRVEGGNLEGFGQGEGFFIDRTEMTAQMFCIGRHSAEVPALLQGYINFIRDEGLPVPQEYLLRRFTERIDREGLDHRVDMVYVEDLLRSGYTCEELGNLALPGSETIKQFLDAYRFRSQRSFSIVG